VRLAAQLAFLAAVLAAVTLVAELLGAASLGTALGIGQVGFTAALVWLLLRR
jgi:hypothetical protein